MKRVYIGLGSNLNDPVQQVTLAINALQQFSQSIFISHSRLYWSKSLLIGQPDYCNAVAAIDTHLTAEGLLEGLHAIENSQGRVRQQEKWGPRIIDLDILLYADQIIHTPQLTIPHKELLNRNFWLYPLAEIATDLTIPGQNISLQHLVQDELPQGLKSVC